MKIPPGLIAPVANVLYRLWCSTLSYTESNREPADALARQGAPIVFALWHGELFPLMYVRRDWRVATVVSRSQDGEYLARLLNALGLKTARGSSSRGGVGALLRTAKLMREEKCNACITVDGPRGPRCKVKEGAIFLAHRTPAPIVPIRIFMSRARTFSSWDRFQLPWPFSSVHVVFGDPYPLACSELTPEALEEERLRLEKKLETLAPPAREEGA